MTLTPLYGYVHATYGFHYYTLNASVIGYGMPAGIVGRYHYRSEGITCLMETEQLGKHKGSISNYLMCGHTQSCRSLVDS